MIISPFNKIYNFSFRLEFDASNNGVEYEALFLGLETTKDMGIKMLNIKGDSDLVIQQLKNNYKCKSDRLKKYRNAIWDTMDWFDAVNLQEIPRKMNGLTDKLAVAASTLQLSDEMINGNGKMEINFRPSIPDNINHWQVFDNDKHV